MRERSTCAEVPYRFGHGRVDGLVEADHIVDAAGLQRTGIQPQAQHTGAQCAVFGHELVDVEANPCTQDGVSLRRRFRRAGNPDGASPGFVRLLFAGLRVEQVRGGRLKDLQGVIAKGERGHVGGSRQQGCRELLPFRDDGLGVVLDEGCKAHSVPAWHVEPLWGLRGGDGVATCAKRGDSGGPACISCREHEPFPSNDEPFLKKREPFLSNDGSFLGKDVRFLANHGSFLKKQEPSLATDEAFAQKRQGFQSNVPSLLKKHEPFPSNGDSFSGNDESFVRNGKPFEANGAVAGSGSP